MKENELMIGDWVYDKSLTYPNLPCKVHSIEGRYPRINKEFDSQPIIDVWVGDGFLSSHIENIEPIPLTPEILEKNGFKASYSSCYQEKYSLFVNDEEDCVEYKFSKQTKDFYRLKVYIQCGEAVNIHALHIHELQHALRLCGLNDLADNFKV